ncbi:hypothetical protein C3L33_07493, partial [Rhododendron williamsianum]
MDLTSFIVKEEEDDDDGRSLGRSFESKSHRASAGEGRVLGHRRSSSGPHNQRPLTRQYTLTVSLKTPPQPTTLLLDLGASFAWVDCTRNYTSSTYHHIPCSAPLCTSLHSLSCSNCFDPPGPGCANDSCSMFPENSVTRTAVSAEALIDSLSLPETDGHSPGRPVTLPDFVFSCSITSLLQGLAKGVSGLAGLGRSNISLPAQVSAFFSEPYLFALCLSGSRTASGAAFFNSGTKISTVVPYTVLHASIYKAFTDAFVRESAALNLTVTEAVKPFSVCYSARDVMSTRVGPAVPTVDLVMQSDDVFWRVFGANSMVRIARDDADVWCLGFVDGGTNPRASIVIGGNQMEDNLLQFDVGLKRLGFSSLVLVHGTTRGILLHNSRISKSSNTTTRLRLFLLVDFNNSDHVDTLGKGIYNKLCGILINSMGYYTEKTQRTFDLKLNLHCKHCVNDVRKIVLKIEGVVSIDIDKDLELGKATISGNVDPQTVIKKLKDRANKHAELLGKKKNAHPKSTTRRCKLCCSKIQFELINGRCREDGFTSGYRCKHCIYDLHKGCLNPKPKLTHDLFPGSIFKFRLKFRQKPEKICDACGMEIHGHSYSCKEDKLDLHPACSKLQGNCALAARTSCSAKRSKRDKFCCHVHCLSLVMQEAWKRGRGDLDRNDDDDDNDAISKALEKVDLKLVATAKGSGGEGGGLFLGAVTIFLKTIISILFGIQLV